MLHPIAIDLLAPFVFGLVGSLHCLGMRGPLIVAYSLRLHPADRQATQALLSVKNVHHHAAFHVGRIATCGILGALAAGMADAVGFRQRISGLGSGVSLGGGVLMVIFGFALLKVFPVRLLSLPSWRPGSLPAKCFAALVSSRSWMSKLGLGAFVGFLPCMLTYVMIVKAAATQNVILGFLTMVSFGIGTLPLLFFTGFSASLLGVRTRILGERLAAAAAIFMGLFLLWKGSKYFI